MIWLLSHLEDSPGNKIFLQAAGRKNIEAKLINPLKQHLPVPLSKESLSNGELSLPDIVFTRMGSSAPIQCLHLLRSLESRNIKCINSSESIERSRDKMQTLSRLARFDIPVPRTLLIGHETLAASDLEFLGDPPWILKLPVSSKGQGTMLIESMASLRSVAGTFQELGQTLILQEYIAESRASDIRLLVVGNKVLAGVRRTAQSENEFRSNVYLGGRDEAFLPPAEIAEVAKMATQALSLSIAGVDILESDRGPLVIEVNSSPGLKMVVNSGTTDIGEQLIDWLLAVK